MAASLNSRFISMAQNARAAEAQRMIGAAAAGPKQRGLKKDLSTDNAYDAGNAGPDPILLYPSDIGFNPQEASYMLFTGYSITKAKLVVPTKVPTVGKELSTVEGATAAAKRIFEDSIIGGANRKHGPEGRTDSSFMLAPPGNIPKSGTVIGLYMPPSVNVSYSMDYERGEVGAMGETISNIVKSIQAGATYGAAIKSAAGPALTAAKQKAISATDAVVPGVKDLVAIERGVIITPRTELMFRGISRRQFSFEFNFIPKDRKESKIVHQIVQKFKEGMTPHFNLASTIREMTIPDVFQIDYMHITKQNSYLNKIGKCYLEKMDVTYGGDKFVTYDDAGDGEGPPPQQTKITLSFKELEVMDRSKVSAGF